MKEEQEIAVSVLNYLHEATPLLAKVNSPGVMVKEESRCNAPEATITQEVQQVTIKEEEQELPLTVWNTLHETTPLLVKSTDVITKVKEEAKFEDIQTHSSAVQESVKATPVRKDDTDCLTFTSKPSVLSGDNMARKISSQIPGEIEVHVDIDDLSISKQVLYPGNTHSSEKRCQKRTAVSDLVNEMSAAKIKKVPHCSSKTSDVTAEVVEQDGAEDLQEKVIGTNVISASNRRTFALSVLRDQCLKVITQWYMGQPFSEIVHNMNMNPDSVRHILHVWCTEKRLACHKPSQCKLKGKVRTKKGQVPTLWKWRFLVAVGKNLTLQCMVCDKRLNSSKMDNIACHIRNWHPYSAELPHRVRRAIHQAWKRRQQGVHKAHELQANSTEKHEMTSLKNEQDKITSQQTALQKPEHSPRVKEIKKPINDSGLCNQTEDYAVQHVGNTEEKRELDSHKNDNIQSNNIKQTPTKKQRQMRYFQDQWRQKYLVDYDWKAEEVVCLVCGLRMRCLRSCTFERHAKRRHPESIQYSEEIRNALWESWNKGHHSFPLLNSGSGMGNVKLGSNRMERQPDVIKHHDPGLQEWWGSCVEDLEKKRLQDVQHMDEFPIQQRLQNCQHVQEQQNTISESRLNNNIEDYSVQHAAHNEDKEPDIHFKKPVAQRIWITHTEQNDMPQVLLKSKQKHMRNFQEHWRLKYLVDYDWKTEKAVCILCRLHMRSLRSCTFDRHVQRRHPESIFYPEETRIALWKAWSKGEHTYSLYHTGCSISDTSMFQDEMESQPSWSENHGPSIRTEEYIARQGEHAEEHRSIKQEQRSQNCLQVQEQQNTISESKLNYQIENYTIQYVKHHEDNKSNIHFKQPYIQHIWNIHEEQIGMPQVLLKKQKHVRNFQEHWRLKYLVDFDWKTEEAVCILCGLHMRSLRNCTFERHVQRRHPESIHYPKETRIALWRAWSNGEYNYTVHQTGGRISDPDMCQDETKSQPSWQENHKPSMNTEEYLAIQQEQIESVLKSANSHREIYS